MIRNVNIKAQDSASVDAFGRWRVSNPATLFDSKQLYDNQPRVWDDQEVSGGSTGSTHSANEAATTISVANTTAGKRVRQTFGRFNYQPGKSQQIFLTFSEFDTATGITKEVGLFDDNNGIFLRSDEGTYSVVVRSYVTGSAVDTVTARVNWDDPMDGLGPSGINIDFTKVQILVIDFEWLGAGRIRFGFNVDGVTHYFHEKNHANIISTVYMSTPNLPLRYSIENDSNGAADDFVHICATVISEGGEQLTGQLFGIDTGTTHLDADTIDTTYALFGIRMKTAYIGTNIDLLRFSVLAETNNDFKWSLYLNPTVAGTFTYNGLTNSAVEYAVGATANTVTGGTLIESGFVSEDAHQDRSELKSSFRLGSAINGTRDALVLTVTPLSASADIQGSLNWRELS